METPGLAFNGVRGESPVGEINREQLLFILVTFYVANVQHGYVKEQLQCINQDALRHLYHIFTEMGGKSLHI